MLRCTRCGTFNRILQPHPDEQARCGYCGAGLERSAYPQVVSDAALARALGGLPVPVLVEFGARWCAPCAMAASTLEQVARAFAGELVVLKVDIEMAPLSAELHGVRGVPTFVLFAGGMEQARQTGMLPSAKFNEWVTRHLAHIHAQGRHASAGAGSGTSAHA